MKLKAVEEWKNIKEESHGGHFNKTKIVVKKYTKKSGKAWDEWQIILKAADLSRNTTYSKYSCNQIIITKVTASLEPKCRDYGKKITA